MKLRDRLHLATIDAAQAAFWSAVAARYPEVKSGDFPPDAQFVFDQACENAVAAWLKSNKPEDPYLAILTAMGFEEEGTGGGCTALVFERPDGQQCMVTNDALAPKPGEQWDVGFYASADDRLSGEQIGYTCYPHKALLKALAKIAAWRVG